MNADAASRLHLPSLAAGVLVVLAATLYPPLMTAADGRVDHGMAAALFMAMSAGLVRGVGFVPRLRWLRWLFSGWTCLGALSLAAWLRHLH
jgi:predicted membrane protein